MLHGVYNIVFGLACVWTGVWNWTFDINAGWGMPPRGSVNSLESQITLNIVLYWAEICGDLLRCAVGLHIRRFGISPDSGDPIAFTRPVGTDVVGCGVTNRPKQLKSGGIGPLSSRPTRSSMSRHAISEVERRAGEGGERSRLQTVSACNRETDLQRPRTEAAQGLPRPGLCTCL